jgi:hypothetical protein
MVPEE